MRDIYILLTRSRTSLSRVVHLVTREPYTHASLVFDLSKDTAYSFTRNRKERILPAGINAEYLWDRYEDQEDTPCALYRLEVTEEAYEQARRRVESMLADEYRYSFNILGLALCQFNISLERRHHFFCSQFVGVVLSESGALELAKAPSLMRPMDYDQLREATCIYRGTMGDLLHRRESYHAQEISTYATTSANRVAGSGVAG